MTQQELAAQLAAVQRQLSELTAEVARNDAKMARSQQRELRLLEADNLDAVFREMVAGLRKSYGLQAVTVVFCDPDYDVRHLMVASGTPADDIDNLLMVESLAGLSPQYVALVDPWLGPFASCDHGLIFPKSRGLKSIAIIPLRSRGKLIGTINLGSADPARFTSRHASDFLAHLGVIASVSIENVINRARLLRSGFTDVLTGWHNRRYLLVRMQEELARAQRERSGLMCLMLDIDHFKSVNDTYGHIAGDAVLCEIAQRVESQVRASDVAARYGGEEFIILLPGTDENASLLLAERIRGAISAEPVSLPGNNEALSITASIGIAGVQPAADIGDLKTLGESLIARADVALYRAKADGRDRVVIEGA